MYKEARRKLDQVGRFPGDVHDRQRLAQPRDVCGGLDGQRYLLETGSIGKLRDDRKGERHGGIIKDKMKTMNEQRDMTQAGDVANEVKNDSMRRGGFSPSRRLVGKHPR